MLASEAVVHEPIPYTNIPDDTRCFAPTFDPGTGIFTMVARESGLFFYVFSSNLLVDAALRQCFNFKLIYILLQFSSEKSVLELG